MDYQQIEDQLAKVLSPHRFRHSLNVSRQAGELAGRYGIDHHQARLAGLVHDCARDMTADELLVAARTLKLDTDPVEIREPVLLHAAVGAAYLPLHYGIYDQDVCRAVRLHTVGAPEMNLLDKVLYLADYIEPGRNFSGVDAVRDLAGENLQQALLLALDQSIQHVIRRGGLVHPATILCRNALLVAEAAGD